MKAIGFKHDGFLPKSQQNCAGRNLFQLITSFLRFQRVIFKCQTSGWLTIRAGRPQSLNLGQLFFLIEIENLTNNLESKVKLFPMIIHLYFPLDNANIQNNDLRKIRKWAKKSVFKPDPTKQTQETIFSKKSHCPKYHN